MKVEFQLSYHLQTGSPKVFWLKHMWREMTTAALHYPIQTLPLWHMCCDIICIYEKGRACVTMLQSCFCYFDESTRSSDASAHWTSETPANQFLKNRYELDARNCGELGKASMLIVVVGLPWTGEIVVSPWIIEIIV